MKPVLDLVIDANVVFVLAFGLWLGAQAYLRRSRLKADYATQLRLLRAVVILVVLSPVLSHVAVFIGQSMWPKTPITVSDLAVAAYLRGEIAIPALQFEALLNTRSRVLETVVSGEVPWITALFAVLVAGAAAHVAGTIWSASRVSRALSHSYLWRRTRTADIRLSDTVTMPFAARGLFRRHVVLPSDLIANRKELRMVLAHEFEHLRQGDLEWELAFEFLRPILYWNPVYLLWRRAFNRLRELSCDQSVVAARRIAPRDYARCLLDFSEKEASGAGPKVLNVAFVRIGTRAARNALAFRILAIHEAGHGPRRGLALPVLACALGLGIILAAASVRQPGDWSQDRLMLSTIVNLERLEAINRGY